ncbi:MAG TPA: PilN domain-containing protein [Gemmatirosa sp.]
MTLIEINLLDPDGDSSGRGVADAVAAIGARARALIGDAYLAGAIAAVLLAAGAGGFLYSGQARAEAAMAERERTATADSTRYAALLAARRGATAERDSVQRQLGVITAIDSARYAWAHVLDEVSRALPPYTWLTAVQQTSAPPMPVAPARPAKGGGDGAAADHPVGDRAGKPDSAAAHRALAFRIVGQTVDIQALTAFMRDLEASPFVQHVQLARSEAAQVDGKDVTEFTLDAELQTPPRDVLRTERLAVPVAPAR